MDKYNRITVRLDEDVYKGIIKLRTKIIKRRKNRKKTTCNFSEALSIVLKKAIKKSK